jgi:hypothetical protein
MKTSTLYVLSSVFWTIYAHSNPITIRVNDEIDELTTKSGNVYKNVTIREIKKSGVKIFHSYGARTVSAHELPDYAFLFDRIPEPIKKIPATAPVNNNLRLTNGKTYKNVKITRKYPDSINITHSTGESQIPYEQLSRATQQALGGFNQDEAKAYRASIQESRIHSIKSSDKSDRHKNPQITGPNENQKPVKAPASYNRNAFRLWTNMETGRTINAKLVAKSKKGTHVELQKKDSKKIIIKTSKLSANDRHFISQMNVAELKERPGGLKMTARTVSWGTKRSSWSYIWGNLDSSGAQILSYREKNKDSYRQLGVELRPKLSSRGGDYIVEVFWLGFPLSKKNKRYVCAAGIRIVPVPPSGISFGVLSNYNYRETSLFYLESDPLFREWESLYVRTWSGYTYAGWAVRVSDGYGKVVAIQGAQPSFLRHINDIPIPRIK